MGFMKNFIYWFGSTVIVESGNSKERCVLDVIGMVISPKVIL